MGVDLAKDEVPFGFIGGFWILGLFKVWIYGWKLVRKEFQRFLDRNGLPSDWVVSSSIWLHNGEIVKVLTSIKIRMDIWIWVNAKTRLQGIVFANLMLFESVVISQSINSHRDWHIFGFELRLIEREGLRIFVIGLRILFSLLQWGIFGNMIKVFPCCFFWNLGNQISQGRRESFRNIRSIYQTERMEIIGCYLRNELVNLDPVIDAVWIREFPWLVRDLWRGLKEWNSYKKRRLRNRNLLNTHSLSFNHSYTVVQKKVFLVIIMSQSAMLMKEDSGKKVAVVSNRMKISVPHFDNTELIRGYAKTLIGRCMNPRMQDIKSLLYLLPKIWKMEERIAGADLGMGRFQLDFDNEEDIEAVLKMGPFHFDYWMLSLVRWEPIVDQRYPYTITFWVRAMGVPLHFWAVPTFMSIGDGIGKAREVDLDNGKVQVVLDGFKPLVFETVVSFYNGEETIVSLRYEKLHGYCRLCFSLCHDREMCPLREKPEEKNDKIKRQQEEHGKGHNVERRMASYRGVVINGNDGDRHASKENNGRGPENHTKGKSKMYDEGVPHRSEYRKSYRSYDRRSGEGSSVQSFSNRKSPKDRHSHVNESQKIKQQVKESTGEQALTDQEKLLLDTLLAKATKQGLSKIAEEPNDQSLQGNSTKGSRSPNKVRKELIFDGNMVDLEEPSPADGTLAHELGSNLLLAEDGMDVWDQMTEAEQPVDENQVENLVNKENMGTTEEGEKNMDLEMKDTNAKSEIVREEPLQENGEKRVGGKKKTVPVNPIFVGRLSKKRLVQNIISPRKKGVTKTGTRLGKESGGGEGKSEMSSQMETKGPDDASI